MSDKDGWQTLTIDTIAGPKPLQAPVGWSFDKTTTIVWNMLVNRTVEARKKQKLKRDEYVLDGQIRDLSRVLASSIGMAGFYWMDKARKLAAKVLRDS